MSQNLEKRIKELEKEVESLKKYKMMVSELVHFGSDHRHLTESTIYKKMRKALVDDFNEAFEAVKKSMGL